MIEGGPRIYAGSLKNPGHLFSTFIVGEHITEDEHTVTLRYVIRAYEMPDPNNGQLSLKFIPDPFFTVDKYTTVEKQNLLMGRILDPETDISILMQVNGLLQTIRAKRSGLVLPNLDMNTISRQKVLNEKR